VLYERDTQMEEHFFQDSVEFSNREKSHITSPQLILMSQIIHKFYKPG